MSRHFSAESVNCVEISVEDSKLFWGIVLFGYVAPLSPYDNFFGANAYHFLLLLSCFVFVAPFHSGFIKSWIDKPFVCLGTVLPRVYASDLEGFGSGDVCGSTTSGEYQRQEQEESLHQLASAKAFRTLLHSVVR